MLARAVLQYLCAVQPTAQKLRKAMVNVVDNGFLIDAEQATDQPSLNRHDAAQRADVGAYRA